MIKIYSTLTRTKEEFKPIKEGNLGIYVCGPTVYGPPHLGHAKSYINFDTIVRYFKYLNYKVKYVQNITDVGHLVGDSDDGEDKILKQAKKENLDAYEIAYKYEVDYFKNMDALNVLRPSVSCRATGFVNEMIEMVKDIINKGYGYVTKEGNVYFDVRKYEKYGQLSNRKIENALSGERIEVATDKKNPEDFALWKSVDENTLMQWDSPWGKGCPGWHMECTALGRKFLGEKFDIHGGGIDNIFPHHECECAQGDVVLGHLPMNYFMHNGLVTVGGTKMGKSLGNSITLQDLLKKYGPMVIRYFILQFQYRSAVDFNEESLELAAKQFAKIEESVKGLRSITQEIDKNIVSSELIAIKEKFEEAMNDDFNTSLAMVEFNKLIKIINTHDNLSQIAPQINYLISALGEDVFGLRFSESKQQDDIPSDIKVMAEERWVAKQSRDWAKADELRAKLLNLGYEILDSKDGYKINKK